MGGGKRIYEDGGVVYQMVLRDERRLKGKDGIKAWKRYRSANERRIMGPVRSMKSQEERDCWGDGSLGTLGTQHGTKSLADLKMCFGRRVLINAKEDVQNLRVGRRSIVDTCVMAVGEQNRKCLFEEGPPKKTTDGSDGQRCHWGFGACPAIGDSLLAFRGGNEVLLNKSSKCRRCLKSESEAISVWSNRVRSWIDCCWCWKKGVGS